MRNSILLKHYVLALAVVLTGAFAPGCHCTKEGQSPAGSAEAPGAALPSFKTAEEALAAAPETSSLVLVLSPLADINSKAGAMAVKLGMPAESAETMFADAFEAILPPETKGQPFMQRLEAAGIDASLPWMVTLDTSTLDPATKEALGQAMGRESSGTAMTPEDMATAMLAMKQSNLALFVPATDPAKVKAAMGRFMKLAPDAVWTPAKSSKAGAEEVMGGMVVVAARGKHLVFANSVTLADTLALATNEAAPMAPLSTLPADGAKIIFACEPVSAAPLLKGLASALRETQSEAATMIDAMTTQSSALTSQPGVYPFMVTAFVSDDAADVSIWMDGKALPAMTTSLGPPKPMLSLSRLPKDYTACMAVQLTQQTLKDASQNWMNMLPEEMRDDPDAAKTSGYIMMAAEALGGELLLAAFPPSAEGKPEIMFGLTLTSPDMTKSMLPMFGVSPTPVGNEGGTDIFAIEDPSGMLPGQIQLAFQGDMLVAATSPERLASFLNATAQDSAAAGPYFMVNVRPAFATTLGPLMAEKAEGAQADAMAKSLKEMSLSFEPGPEDWYRLGWSMSLR